MTKVMPILIALIFQSIKGLVCNLPACAPAFHEMLKCWFRNRHICYPSAMFNSATTGCFVVINQIDQLFRMWFIQWDLMDITAMVFRTIDVNVLVAAYRTIQALKQETVVPDLTRSTYRIFIDLRNARCGPLAYKASSTTVIFSFRWALRTLAHSRDTAGPLCWVAVVHKIQSVTNRCQ